VSGWVKSYRTMLDHPLLQRADEMGLWTKLLLMSAAKPTRVRFRGKLIMLERGQVACSIREVARAARITHKRIRLILDSWVADGMLKMGTPRGTKLSLVTICNYEIYQDNTNPAGRRPGHNEGTTGAQLGHTEQERENLEEIPSSLRSEGAPPPLHETPMGPTKGPPPGTVLREAVTIWNDTCGDLLGRVKKLTPQRAAHLRKRLADDFSGSLDEWRSYCGRIRATEFLTGSNDRGWRADFDFAVTDRGCVRIREGRFDSCSENRSGKPDPTLTAYRNLAKRYAAHDGKSAAGAGPADDGDKAPGYWLQ
jgi:hypothetical protein